MATSIISSQFLSFLESDLAIPADAISLALRRGQQRPNQLPMILWQHGLITLDQLDQIFDWLERKASGPTVVITDG